MNLKIVILVRRMNGIPFHLSEGVRLSNKVKCSQARLVRQLKSEHTWGQFYKNFYGAGYAKISYFTQKFE
jgi:hypothetical protein